MCMEHSYLWHVYIKLPSQQLHDGMWLHLRVFGCEKVLDSLDHVAQHHLHEVQSPRQSTLFVQSSVSGIQAKYAVKLAASNVQSSLQVQGMHKGHQ